MNKHDIHAATNCHKSNKRAAEAYIPHVGSLARCHKCNLKAACPTALTSQWVYWRTRQVCAVWPSNKKLNWRPAPNTRVLIKRAWIGHYAGEANKLLSFPWDGCPLSICPTHCFYAMNRFQMALLGALWWAKSWPIVAGWKKIQLKEKALDPQSCVKTLEGSCLHITAYFLYIFISYFYQNLTIKSGSL